MSKSITLSKAVEGFLFYKSASGLSEHSISDYRNSLKRLIEFLNDPPLASIQAKDLDRFFVHLRENVKVTKVCGVTEITPRKLSNKTILNIWGGCNVFFKWAAREFETGNPFSVERVKAKTKPIVPLSKEEVERLFKACDQTKQAQSDRRKSFVMARPTKKRDKALLSLLLDTGMRISELCNIRIKDVDFRIGRILVTGKGSKSRYVYIGKGCRQAVWSYLSERYPDGEPKADEYLFLDNDNWGPLNRDSARNLLKRLGEKAEVRNVHPHRFRHTFAIQYLRNNGDIYTLQQMLGHSSLDMVKNYLRISEVDVEAVHQKASPLDNWRLR